MKPRISWFLILSVLISYSCTKKNQLYENLLQLSIKENEIECSMSAMKDSIATAWDVLNEKLQRAIPKNTSEKERKYMTRVRNANMIRMFKSYRKLDTTFQRTLSETERYDKELSNRLLLLKKRLSDIEMKKRTALSKLSAHPDKKTITTYKKEAEKIKNTPCQ